MSISATAPAASWLNSFDPLNPSTSLQGLVNSPTSNSSTSLLNTFDPTNPSTYPAASANAANSASSLLNTFDPTNPSTFPVGTNVSDPSQASTPAGNSVLNPTPTAPAPGPNQLQQGLDAFTTSADTYLIQSAVNGYQPLAAPAAFGSSASYYSTLNDTAQTILSAAQSGNYGNINALA